LSRIEAIDAAIGYQALDRSQIPLSNCVLPGGVSTNAYLHPAVGSQIDNRVYDSALALYSSTSAGPAAARHDTPDANATLAPGGTNGTPGAFDMAQIGPDPLMDFLENAETFNFDAIFNEVNMDGVLT
jgi:hypothetical protein